MCACVFVCVYCVCVASVCAVEHSGLAEGCVFYYRYFSGVTQRSGKLAQWCEQGMVLLLSAAPSSPWDVAAPLGRDCTFGT